MKPFIIDYFKKNDVTTISYSTLMELALYDETNGYYQQDKTKIGKQGDFLTTSTVSPFYAKVIAEWFFQMVINNECEANFYEIGAGTGEFAYSLIEHWEEISTIPLNYYIVEKSHAHLKEIKKNVLKFDSIHFLSSIDDLSDINGVIFSNELFDAFPVDLVKYEQGNWYEMVVELDEISNQLKNKLIPCERLELIKYFEEYQLPFKEGFTYEVPLKMLETYKLLCGKLLNGKIITVDYGYFHEELQEDIHAEGTLRAYYNHQLLTDFFNVIGEVDLTTHIHWDSLLKVGTTNGLHTNSIVTQRQFLIEQNILQFLKPTNGNPFSEEARINRKIRQLILDDFISSAFHVLIQEKKERQSR